jgi:Asp-tRNA(Asn)/Glu-tRNA(Gln) amidotransferase A subunit family amidase
MSKTTEHKTTKKGTGPVSVTLEDADRVIYTLMSTMSTSNHEVFNVGDQRTPIVGMYLFKVLKETLTNASLNKLITGKEIFLPEPTLPQPIEERVISFNYRSNKFNPNKHLINFVKTNVEAFKDVDVIAMPVSPTPAFKIGEKMNDPLQMYLADIFTIVANVVGVPSISIPGGTVDREGSNLPVGLQLLAPQLQENRLFELGKKFEVIK